MALERLWKREAQLAATDAEASFVAQQEEVVERINHEAFQAATTEVHADNTAKLTELEELGERLAVPELAEEINRSVREATLECRPFSWMPYTPAIIDSSLTARNGLMAIHGWAIAPKESSPNRLSMFVGLYHEKRDDTYQVPKMAVSNLFQRDPTNPGSPSYDLERLLQQDSAAVYEYLRLLLWRDQRPGDSSKEPELEAYYKAVMEWGKQLATTQERSDAADMVKANYTYWELDNPEWDDPQALQPMTLARHVKAADNMLDTVGEYGFPSNYIPPEALNKTSRVYQSWRSLDVIERLFLPPSVETVRSRRGKKVLRAAGGMAANTTVVINPNDAYTDLRDKADKFYDEAQSELQDKL